jgi:hypothetical protein
MASYRIYLIDTKGVRAPAVEAKCATDEEAAALAQRIIVIPKGTAEVWLGDRLVAIVSRITAMEINGVAAPYGRPQLDS